MFRISIITTISFVFYFVMSSCLVCYNQNGQNWCALEQELYIGIFGMICWIGFISYGHFPRSSFSWCAQGPHIFWWPHGTMNTSGSLSMQMSHVTVLSSCGCVGGCSRISSSLESWYSSGVTASSLESSESVLFSRVSHSSAAHSSKYLSFETLKEYVTALKNSRELYSSFSSFSSAFGGGKFKTGAQSEIIPSPGSPYRWEKIRHQYF